MSLKTRSTFSIDAVAQAAANGGAKVLIPIRQLGTIAGLAGFVLRLCRSRQVVPTRIRPEQKRQQGCSKDPARMSEGSKGGRRHG